MDITESAIATAMRVAMSHLAVSFPIIIVWIVGIFFAFARWRRNPKVSLLVIISCGLSLFLTLVIPFVQQLVVAMSGTNHMSIHGLLMAVSFVWACLPAASTALLLYAAFVDRPERES
jgi:hypothetical protein